MTHGGTSIAMRRRLWVRGYCVSPSWNVHVDCDLCGCNVYWVLFNMRCTQYTVLKSHAVLKTHAVQSPTDVGPIWICAECGLRVPTQQSPELTLHPPVAVDVQEQVHTDPLVHASRSTYTRFRDQYPFHTYSRTRTPPRGDPTLTRDRGRSGTIQLTGASPVYHAVYTVQV